MTKLRSPFTAVIGAGQVGATTAQRLIEKGICDVMLFDIVEGLPQGKALDLMEAAPLEGHDRRILGTHHYQDLAGAEVVVVTAGLPRKPGMSREDLLSANAKIVTEISAQLKVHTPEAKVILVTNPLDLMTYLAYKKTGFPPERIFGMAGVLDTARMRFFLAEALKAARPQEVEAIVLGGHGDLMVPVSSRSRHGSKPVKDLLPPETLSAIEKRTQNGGAEIVKLLKTGSAYYAPASSVCEMVRVILKDEKKIMPVCAHLNGEYGLSDIYFGVPAQLGRKGVLRIEELPLSDQEKKALSLSAGKVSQGIAELTKLGLV